MSPIRRLPFDIIEGIFAACLPTHRNCVMSAQEAPVILGRICSSWRNISLSTPRLWSRLHIVEPVIPQLPVPLSPSNRRLLDAKTAHRLRRLEVTSAWLGRSGECPLSISLESNDPHGRLPLVNSDSPPEPDLFLSALIPFAHRWQKIRFAVQPSALQTLSSLTAKDVPLLQHLQIYYSYNPINTEWSLSQLAVLRSPSLAEFSLWGSFANSLDLPLRWNELTELSLFPPWGARHRHTCQVVMDILSACPKLRTCGMLVHHSPEEPLSGSVVECPFLHTLDLQCLDGTPAHTSGRLLNQLSLPNLQEFKLRGQQVPQSASNADSLVSSLAASPRLESITINSDSFTRLSLMDFCRGLSATVQRLLIVETMWPPSPADSPLDDDVLAALATYCPALQELVILNCITVSDEALPSLHNFRNVCTQARRGQIRPGEGG
ncbi:F-box domain-containing protein [Mycena venus]|uniref:F-box domain-containing protein n=1 Tax=Mycena venus TaxID=2733690 RepID=A0A8H6WY72_9AGAR|nr:F-box domain-containing protein [Mycena venus]